MKKDFEEYKNWCLRVRVEPSRLGSLDMFYAFKRAERSQTPSYIQHMLKHS